MSQTDMQQLKDVPKGGPLEKYRLKSSFNWKKMKLFFEDIDLIKFKEHIWETLRNDPLFIRPSEEPAISVQKEICYKRAKRLNEYAFLTKEQLYENPIKRILFDEAVITWDLAASIKYSLHFQVKANFLS
jgi:acyl-CoA oxidase